MDFERRHFESQPYIYVDGECAYEAAEISAAMGAGFGQIMGFVSANDIRPLSMPMTVYVSMASDKLRFRAGILVSDEDAAKAEGDVKADNLPEGDAMCGLHIGSYSKLSESHQAMWSHMKENGIEAVMPVWEIYVDDPGQVEESALRTEFYRAIG